jgi:hypothetical protein
VKLEDDDDDNNSRPTCEEVAMTHFVVKVLYSDIFLSRLTIVIDYYVTVHVFER